MELAGLALRTPVIAAYDIRRGMFQGGGLVMRSIVNVIVVYLWLGNIVAAQPQSQRPQGERITILTSIQLPIAAPRTEVLTALPGAAQEQISKSPVPVLLLPNVGEFTAKRIMVENVYYAAFFSDGKQTISIEVSRLAYRYSGQHLLSDKAEKDSIRSTQGFITDSEGIWTASWKEFGAAYFISLECAEEKDDRCRSGDYVLRLANSLVYVGGGRAASETQGPEVPSLGEERREIKKFSYHPPGELLPGSGTGRHDETVYAPGIRFPIEKLPAYANSQVWNPGGKSGPPGGDQCDPNNYSYPWWDNFCETRGWKTPMCPDRKSTR